MNIISPARAAQPALPATHHRRPPVTGPRGPAAPALLATIATAAFLATACAPATRTQPTTPAATPRHPGTASLASPASPPAAYGDLRLGFIPATAAARPVRPPLTVVLVIRPARGGAQTTWTTVNAPAARGFGFQLTLPPGRYRLQALGLRGPSLSPAMIAVPTGGPAFTVPPTGCAYLGVITIVFYRLPPGSPSQQGSAASQLAHGKTGYFTYLRTGGLLGDTASTGQLPAPDRPAGSQACAVRPAKF